MKRSTILAAVAVAVVTVALTAQAGAVPGPVAQQETPTESPVPSPAENETEDEPLPSENETEDEPLPGENETEDEPLVPADGADNETENVSSLTFDDQETNGTNLTVSNVTLTEPGYVVIHDNSLDQGETLDSVIGVSEYLPAGEYTDVNVTLFNVPGSNYTADGERVSEADANATANDTEPSLNSSQQLTAMLHAENSPTPTVAANESADNETMGADNETMGTDNETMGADNETMGTDNATMGADNETAESMNQTFDFVQTVGLLDTPILVNDTPVTDTANVTVVEDDAENATATTETATEDEPALTTGNETEDGTGTPAEAGAGDEAGTPAAPAEGTATPSTP